MSQPLMSWMPAVLSAVLILGADLPAQDASSWYRPNTPDPWGGSVQPWGGQTGVSVGQPYNNRAAFGSGGRRGQAGGMQGGMRGGNALWGWIGVGQPKAYGTYLPPYPESRSGGRAGTAYSGQGVGGQSGASAVSRYLYGKEAYGSQLPGELRKKGPSTGKAAIPGIPKWLNQPGRGRRILSKEDLGYGRDPARCFLLRMQDRVEVRPAGEEAFYRLDYWDKARVLAPGSGIRVVAGGRALVVFPAGTQLDMVRPAEVWFRKGSQELLELDCRDIHTAHVSFGMRDVRMSLPEGSRIRGSNLSFSITRMRRTAMWMPGETEDHLVVKNWGPNKLYLDSQVPGAETVTILANRRVVLPIPVVREPAPRALLSPQELADDPPLDLGMEGGGAPMQASVQADIRFEEQSLVIRSRVGKARLQWGGFSARLQQGWRLLIDPIGGKPFGEGRAVPHQRIPSKEPKK